MKFMIGDETDRALCVALRHEFLRSDDAFQDFAALARDLLGDQANKRLTFRCYNAYARFLHHTYEFYIGATLRERGDLSKLSAELAEKYILSHLQNIVTMRRQAIQKGTAPSWENDLSSFPEKVPIGFAREFRACRNFANGHVLPKRTTLDLSDFYDRNHRFVHMLYYSAREWWGRQRDEFPDLGEITKFSVSIRSSELSSKE